MPTKTKKVLLVEDNPGDVLLMEEAFKEHGKGEFQLFHSDSLRGALEKHSKEPMDAVLLDLFLPDTYGLESLFQANRAMPGVPIIAMSSFYDEKVGSHAREMGAQTYLSKNDLDGESLIQTLRRHTNPGP
jgi:DNA-binding response OmpR family regulator